MDFVPLHVYSGYSFLRSGLNVRSICAFSKKASYFGVGLTDFESMSGYPELDKYLKGETLKPVYGLDVEVDGILLSLFLQSEVGYKNLVLINLEASRGKVTKEFLLSHQEGVTIVLPSEYSPLRRFYKEESAEEKCKDWLFSFSKGIFSFYVGIPYLPEEKDFVLFLRNLIEKYPYDSVAFPHILYSKESDAIVLDIVSAIAREENLTEKERNGSNYFLEPETIASFFSEKEISSTKEIAQKSEFTFLKKRGGLLHFPNELGLSSPDYLKKLAYEGLEKKNPGYGKEYKERLDYELDVIIKMGYADYFLLVQDFIKFSLENDVPVGPGRGSGPASLVSYSLGICTPDPLKHDLLFERFLNPERQSMPDIDSDFGDLKRDEVVNYLQEKYGKGRVAHIITMQTIGARQSIRDIGRVYRYEDREIDLLAKSIRGYDTTLRDEYKYNKRFRDLVDSDPYYLGIVKLASKIEGLPRQSGLHAAGIVLNDTPLEEAIPVKENPIIGYVCSYEMNHLEAQGFLKMDILGLRNLTIIEKCIDNIEKTTGKKLDYRTIPTDDPEAIKLIASSKTMGLFQLESPGMKRTIKEIEPSRFEDIVALVALFRPGPMQNIGSYARRKKGLEKVNYLCPELEKYLSSTYGILVYQEQVMQVVRAMSGCSFAEADNFRRAISKKDAAKLASLKEGFINGSIKNGHDKTVAEKVYALIYEFADYGFNKAHAVSYATLACQMAHLKAHYPKEFYAAILDETSTKDQKFTEMLSEMKSIGLKLSIPDVNLSDSHFVIDGDSLVFPLSGIKSIQSAFVNSLLDERAKNGPYGDIFDFAKRMKPHGLTLPLLVKMIDAGALDSLNKEKNRSRLRSSAASALSYAEMFVGVTGTEALFELDIPKPVLVDVPNQVEDNLNSEKEALGIMVSGSPLSLHMDALKGETFIPISEAKDKFCTVKTAGAIKSIRSIATKNKRTMAFMVLEDDVAEIEITIFCNQYDRYFGILRKDAVILASIHKDDRRENTYVLDEAKEVN